MEQKSSVHQLRSRPPPLRPEVVQMWRSSGSPRGSSLMMELLLLSVRSFYFQLLSNQLRLLLQN